MSERNYEEIKKMTEEQEKALRFEHFSNKDALDLGIFITNKILFLSEEVSRFA